METSEKIPRKNFGFWEFCKKSLKIGILLGLFLTFLSASFVYVNMDNQLSEQKDCAVIFGAAVWRDDIPSQALFDRTITGINLYKEKKVHCLILSGGKSKYGAHEADVMKKIALKNKIPAKNLFLDYNGNNTLETLKNLQQNFAGKSFVFVSNDFHLARIKLLAWRLGIKNFATQSATYSQGKYSRGSYFFWREVAGVLYYLLAPV